jgi:phytoene synthase
MVAVYAFARIGDDLADEGQWPREIRQERLRAWQLGLHRAVEQPASLAGADRDQLVLAALAHSIRTLELPLSLFDDLISAFGQDTMTTRYDSWADLFDYCRRSANPVGRLVLRIAGAAGEAIERASDALCTALQLTNFWQDFGRDWRAGRLYVPRQVAASCGADEARLAEGRVDAAWMRALEICGRMTDDKFQEGRGVSDAVAGRLRYELRLTWLGGREILRRAMACRAELLHSRPTLGTADVPRLLWNAALWKAAA